METRDKKEVGRGVKGERGVEKAPCNLIGKKIVGGNLVVWWRLEGGDIKGREWSQIIDKLEEMTVLNEFIEELRLINMPFIDGLTMSRLDRFFITKEWLHTWSKIAQWGLQRSVSDHCAIILKEKEVNWGPKPFMLNCWKEDKQYNEFVKAK
ncbi:hypothetical protein CR513_62470, partial [Mucuna pruriens]